MRKDATRDARDARVMGRVDAMTISRLWVRGGDGRRRARRAVARDDGRVGRREARDVVRRASSSSSRVVVVVVSRRVGATTKPFDRTRAEVFCFVLYGRMDAFSVV